MLAVLKKDFMRTGKPKGLSERMVARKDVRQSGLIPDVSFLGPSIVALLARAFVVDTIFHIRGLGRFDVEAARNRDEIRI